MNRYALTLLLGLSVVAVQAKTPAPAEAQVPATAATPAAPATAATPVAAAGETTVITPANTAKPELDPGCVRESGTRIKKRDKKGCTGAPGSSYSRADIDRTGAVDTADAIRKLSPSATVSRGN